MIRLDPQSHLVNPLTDHVPLTEQQRRRQALVDDGLHGAQHPLVLALGIDDPLLVLAGDSKTGPHELAGAEDEFLELLAICGEVGDGAPGHAGLHGRARHGRRDLEDEARVERLGDDVVRPKDGRSAAIGGRDDLARLHPGERGGRLDGGELHRLVDLGRPHVERAAEDERKAEHVVDLVGVVGPPGRHDRVGPALRHQLGHDFRIRIGECEDQRAGREQVEPFGLQDARCGEAKEHVGPGQHFGEGARRGGAGVARHIGRHVRLAIGDTRRPSRR